MPTSACVFGPVPGSPDAVLASARAAKRTEEAAAVQQLVDAVAWAAMHEPVEDTEVAVWWESGAMLPLAGSGAPAVAEFAVAEFAAALGLTTDAGKSLIGQGLELAWRLPKTWKHLQAGQLPAWRARRIASLTMDLSLEAAGWVDKQLAAVAGRVSWAQLDRLLTEARHRSGDWTTTEAEDYSPETRRVRIYADQVSFNGTVHLDAELDLTDALDLDQALVVTAEQLKTLGSTDPLDARRATALGELARNQLALDLTGEVEKGTQDASVVEEVAQRPSRNHPRVKRSVTLFVHLSEDALSGAGGVGRCENTGTPIHPQVIRQWCGHPDAEVTVRPVLDLNDHIRVDQYEVPDRLKTQVDQRDGTCVFPWCTRPAWGCDHDHNLPFDAGGATCSCNVAVLCRRHHRLKTLTPWRYKIPEPGVYLWTSPHGYVFLRDHSGTTDVTPTGLTPIPGCPSDLTDGAADSPTGDPPEQ